MLHSWYSEYFSITLIRIIWCARTSARISFYLQTHVRLQQRHTTSHTTAAQWQLLLCQSSQYIHTKYIWCGTFILVWTMLSEMKWGSSWELFNAYSPQTMAHFLERARESERACDSIIIHIVCAQLLTVLPYAAGPYGSPFVRVQRSCGVFENIKRGFHRNLTRKTKSVWASVCACVILYTNNEIKLDIRTHTQAHMYAPMFGGRKPSSFPDDSRVKYHVQIYKQKFWSSFFCQKSNYMF